MNSLKLLFLLFPMCCFSQCYEVDTLIIDPVNDVALIVVFGQSNSEGTNGTAPAALPNVFNMRTGQPWGWYPYNATNTNLYRVNGSNFYNQLNSVGQEWQDRINNGEALPDLYIINVAMSAQGFGEDSNNSRLNPFSINSNGGYWAAPVNGVTNTNASMFETLRLALREGIDILQGQGKRVLHFGTVLNQWEADAQNVAAANDYYDNINQGRAMVNIELGIVGDFFYWYPRSDAPQFTERATIRAAYSNLDNLPNVKRVDPFNCPNSNAVAPNYGIFIDGVHYNPTTYDCAAGFILNNSTPQIVN